MDRVNKVLKDMSEDGLGIITSADLKDKLMEEEIYLLDIRRREDYDKGHIKNAKHCEWFKVRDLLEKEELPKDKTIITICYSGQSSMQIATILNITGYHALSLLDGMNEWTGEKFNE